MQKLKYFISFFKTSKFFKTCKTLFDMPLNFLGSDMLGVCNDKWKAIPNLYKKTFLIVFLSLNVSWALDMAGFFQITNHDWREGLLYRQSFIPWQVVSGRYFFTFINALLLKGEYLPILSHLTAFAGFSLAAICLCIYWKVPQTLFFYSLICLLAVFQPHFLYLIGYRISFVSFSVTFFFIPLAFIISERYFQKEAARSFCRTVLYIAIPALLFWFVLSTYQQMINAIAVIIIGKIIIEFMSAGINTASFIKLVKTYGWVLISFIAGAFFQYCSILYLKSIGIIQRGNFRTETVALSDFPQRVFEISKTSLIKLYSYIGNADISYINFLFFILLIFLIFNVLLKAVFSNASFLQKILRPFIFILLLAAAFILSNSSAMLEYELTIRRLFEDSLNVFGLTYFHVLIVVLLLRQVTAEERDLRWKNFVKNATVFLSILILYNCAIYNAKIQKTFKLKFEAETKLWNRVIDRIEQVDGFDSGEKYALLTIGRFRSITPYMPDAENNNYLMRRSLDADWASLEGPLTYTNDFTSFRYTSISGRKDITRFYNDADIKALLKMSSEIEKAKPYPDKTSIVIKDGILMVILDQEGLDKARALIQEHRKAQEK